MSLIEYEIEISGERVAELSEMHNQPKGMIVNKHSADR